MLPREKRLKFDVTASPASWTDLMEEGGIRDTHCSEMRSEPGLVLAAVCLDCNTV